MKLHVFFCFAVIWTGSVIIVAAPSLGECYPGLPCPDAVTSQSPDTAPETTVSMPPSFDCSSIQTAAEAAICQSSELALLDNQLSALYGVAKSRLNSSYFRIVRNQQRAWLKQRNACGMDSICIKDLYVSRINQLASL
jgi:uncharacterized protein YecT (DUF1311 family)